MGHFDYIVKVVGKNRRDAEAEATRQFYYEEGHRCGLREQERATLIRKVPPKKQVVTRKYGRYGGMPYDYVDFVEDPTAPPDEWLEEWEFQYDYHC